MDFISGIINKQHDRSFGHFVGEECTNLVKTEFADEEDLFINYMNFIFMSMPLKRNEDFMQINLLIL